MRMARGERKRPGNNEAVAWTLPLPPDPSRWPVNIPVRETGFDAPLGSMVMSARAVHVAVFEFFAGCFTHADHFHIEM